MSVKQMSVTKLHFMRFRLIVNNICHIVGYSLQRLTFLATRTFKRPIQDAFFDVLSRSAAEAIKAALSWKKSQFHVHSYTAKPLR